MPKRFEDLKVNSGSASYWNEIIDDYTNRTNALLSELGEVKNQIDLNKQAIQDFHNAPEIASLEQRANEVQSSLNDRDWLIANRKYVTSNTAWVYNGSGDRYLYPPYGSSMSDLLWVSYHSYYINSYIATDVWMTNPGAHGNRRIYNHYTYRISSNNLSNINYGRNKNGSLSELRFPGNIVYHSQRSGQDRFGKMVDSGNIRREGNRIVVLGGYNWDEENRSDHKPSSSTKVSAFWKRKV